MVVGPSYTMDKLVYMYSVDPITMPSLMLAGILRQTTICEIANNMHVT